MSVEMIERVSGTAVEFAEDAYAPELTGENHSTYTERLAAANHDVEDAGMGMAHLADGSVLELRAAWHMFAPDEADRELTTEEIADRSESTGVEL